MSGETYPCLHCRHEIGAADVNVSTDIALCRCCGRTMSFAELRRADEVDLSVPPKGVRSEESIIHGRTLVYKRASPMVWFLIPFTVLWSGISMTGIYGSQISEGEFDPERSLFGLPFLFGTIVLLSIILYNFLGRWEIRVSSGVLQVVLRIGPFKWARQLAVDPDTRVRMVVTSISQNRRPLHAIEAVSSRGTLKFGTPWPDQVTRYMTVAVRRWLGGG